MRRPPFPFQAVLSRAEDDRDEAQRVFFRRREAWRSQQDACSRQRGDLQSVFATVAEQRVVAPRGAWEQSFTRYAAYQASQLNQLVERETQLGREVEAARRAMLQASLKVRVWETLRERFWEEFAKRERRREEAELEDWTRARLKPRPRRAVV